MAEAELGYPAWEPVAAGDLLAQSPATDDVIQSVVRDEESRQQQRPARREDQEQDQAKIEGQTTRSPVPGQNVETEKSRPA